MASNVVETQVVQIDGGPSGQMYVTGTATLNGGTASFVIAPGHNNTNITTGVATPLGSAGLRQIFRWGVTCSSAENATDVRVVKSYDATNDQDILTVHCVADTTWDWWVEGYNAGA